MADVSKALMSVDAGHHVVIDKVCGIDVSRARYRYPGVPMKFVRRDGVNEIDRDILPFQGDGARVNTFFRFQDMLEVIPLEEDRNVANEHELRVVSAKQLQKAERG